MIEIFAPARICLFGDHQDYLGLPVIACAIDRYIKLSAVENKEKLLKIDLPDIGKERVIPLVEPFISINIQDYFFRRYSNKCRFVEFVSNYCSMDHFFIKNFWRTY